MATFEEILESISDEQMMTSHAGLTLADFGREHPELDNKTLSPDEQKLNLAFWARASAEHVGWDSFGRENNEAFKKAVEKLYAGIGGERKQKDFMLEVARETSDYILDRHFMLMTGSAHQTCYKICNILL